MLAVSFTLTTARDLAYLIAIAGFIFALKGLSSPKHARRGELVGAAAAATLAIAMTFTLPTLRHSGWNLTLTIIAMVLGAAIAVPVARFVKMTAMPQLVAVFNGVGGGAAALISIVELLHLHSLGLQPAVYVTAEVLLGVLIGSVSFSGSAIAFIKLQELITGRPITYPGQQVINALVGAAIGVMIILALVTGSIVYVWIILVLALGLGVIFVLPIGGADVPVLISLLNSFTGLAVAASGFVLDNDLLIVAGTLVGASGIILTRLMSSAMGRFACRTSSSACSARSSLRPPAVRRATRRGRSGRGRPRTWACCWPTRARSSSSPAMAWRSPRPSTPPASWRRLSRHAASRPSSPSTRWRAACRGT